MKIVRLSSSLLGFLFIAFLLGQMLTPAPSFAAGFCWKDSYGRGVGAVPKKCAAGQDRIGLLCYDQCPKGQKRFGFDCHSVCPRGMKSQGLFCRSMEYGRGKGFPWKFGDSLNDNGMRGRCEKNYGKGNCQKQGLIFYRRCLPGYTNIGLICRPKQPDCSKLGLGRRIDLSCVKKVFIGKPLTGICSSSQDKDGGLCYKKCRKGMDGVGPVCWDLAPKGWVNCGMGAASDKKTCTTTVIDQVSSVGSMAINIAAAAATLGGSAAVSTAAKAATKASKLAKLKKKFDTMQKAFKAIKKGKKMAKLLLAAKVAGKLKDGYNAGQEMAKVVTEEDIARVAAQIAGLMDPTGAADVVAAYTYSKCSKYFPSIAELGPESSPTKLERQYGGCRVCLYEEANYEGNWVCVNGGSGNARLKDKKFNLNDKATSIDFQTRDCPKGKSMVATLYQHSEGKGSMLQMDKSDPDFGRLKRGRKKWDDTVSSMYVKMVDTASFNCRACLYDETGYKGAKFCTQGSIRHLKKFGFNDKTSSIKIFNKGCRDAGVTVYEHDGWKGRSARFTASTANVGRGWNNKITGVTFSRTMKATMRAEKARSDKQCRVCFYEHAGFGGKAFCTDGAYANLGSLRAGGRREWNDDISSIRVDVPGCSGGTVTIYEHANYKGKRVTLSTDHGDLKRLNAGGRKWGDQISSLRFNKPAKIKKWQTIKGGALDISIGPNGSIWVIGSNKVPYRWTGKSWKKVPGVKATRIDVGPKGWAWVVGTDGYGYHWRGNKWNKLAGVKISDVSIGANSKAWAIGTDKVGKNHSIYRFTGKWTKVPGSAVRIDVSPLGYPWVVSEHGRVYIWSEQLKKFLAIQPPHSANDIAVSVNGKTMVSIKAGGTATWNGGGWTQDRTKEKLTSIAIDKNNDPWVTTARNQIWAMR